VVDHVLRRDPSAIARLMRAELAAGQDAAGGFLPAESFGISLLAAARKPSAARKPPGLVSPSGPG